MLTKRVIAVILLRDGRAVKSRQFANYRDVGDPVSQARIYYANGIDELVILNTQSEKGIQPLLDVLPKISERCFIPIAAGGGVRTPEDAAQLSRVGCEKFVIRSSICAMKPIAKRFGKQSVVWCCDHRDRDDHIEAKLEGAESCGEVILQNVDRDGMMKGYSFTGVFDNKPYVCLGGCGNYQHMLDAFNDGADACAASSLWAFTDSNPIRAKKWLKNHGVNVRT